MKERFNVLQKYIILYNTKKEDLELVKKAYDIASILHGDQKRESGEPYMIHPLEVAIILAQIQADTSTIVAALLHDSLEDTILKKSDLTYIFGERIASLVDGVTKIDKVNFSSKEEAEATNTRKLLQGMMKDVRILYIKLADRLHNMRTLKFKRREKQKENAKETLDLFVPLASYLGCHQIKNELQTLSFKYYLPEEYNRYYKRQKKMMVKMKDNLDEMMKTLNQTLNEHQIPHQIYVREKNLYEVYEQEKHHEYIHEIHDLVAVKIKVPTIEECYRALGLVHAKYKPFNSKFKDYIVQPKENMYQSLHTTVFVQTSLIQVQIRTNQMDRIANLGLTAYWNDHNVVMHEELQKHFSFFKSLVEINQTTHKDTEFIKDIFNEVLTKNIYVHTSDGSWIELPEGSTAIDFAYKIHTDLGNHLSGVIVNGQFVRLDYLLKNDDIVKIISTENGEPKEEWLNKCKTINAKRKILKYLKEK